MSRAALEDETGKLFQDLWGPYDQKLFEESVELFARRLDLAQFDRAWFRGKTCLDAGCGGGRNTIAMARLGAKAVHGIDLGAKGIEDARRRSHDMLNVDFRQASIMEIPFEDSLFDMVWCAGVLMIVDDENIALDELARVTKHGGYLYLLIYATDGMRWPLIQLLRPIAMQIGQPEIERAIEAAKLPPNKRRTFLDDLFCPKLDFYHWDRLRKMLNVRGFNKIDRWGANCRLDHEHSLRSYREDLESLAAVFEAGRNPSFGMSETTALFEEGFNATQASINTIRWFEESVAHGRLREEEALTRVIGQGHHRVLATKGS